MEDRRFLFNVEKLAAYIIYEYNQKTGKDISTLKLQKTLYFCFAYWGAFVKSGQKNHEYAEINVMDYTPYLFKDKIEAWVYGPVIPTIYRKTDELIRKKARINNLFETEEELRAKEIIDTLIKDVIEMNDFELVDLSHKDKSWIANFKEEDDKHDREIGKEDIINEYIIKQNN